MVPNPPARWSCSSPRRSGRPARADAGVCAHRRTGGTVKILRLTALVHDAQGDRSMAVDGLSAASTTTPEPGAYARLFLAEGEPRLTLLRHAQHLGLPDGHPARVVAAHERSAPNPNARRPVERGETHVLRLLDSDLTGPEIAHTLFVSHNTVRTHTRRIFAKLQVTTPVSGHPCRRASAAVTPAPSSISPSRSHRWTRWRHPRAAIRFGMSRRTRQASAHCVLPARSRRQLRTDLPPVRPGVHCEPPAGIGG